MHVLVNAVRLFCDVEGANLTPDGGRPHSSDQKSGGQRRGARDLVRFERFTERIAGRP